MDPITSITFWSTDECVKKEGNTWKVDFKKLWDHPHLKCQYLEDMETLLIREALDEENVTKVKEYTITCNLRAKLAEGYRNGTFKPYMSKDQSDFQKKTGRTSVVVVGGGYNKTIYHTEDDKEAYQKYLDEFKNASNYDGYSFGGYFGLDELSDHRKMVKIDTEYKEIKTTTPSRTFWELLFAYPLNSRLKEVYDKRPTHMDVLYHIMKRLNSSRGRAAYIAEQFLDPSKLLTIEYKTNKEIKWFLRDIMTTLYYRFIKGVTDREKEWSEQSEYNRETYNKYNILLINIFKDRCLKTKQSGSYFWEGMYELYKKPTEIPALREEDWKSIFKEYPIKRKDFMNQAIFKRSESELWKTLKEALIEYDCWYNQRFTGTLKKNPKCEGRLLKLKL